MDYAVSFFMLGEAARLAIAAIFALAAFHAMRDWTVFGGIIEQYRVVPPRLAAILSRVLPPLQGLASAALVLPTTSPAGALLGLCLMALFTSAIVVNLARGRVMIDCGCGGARGQRLSMGLVARNLVIMAGLTAAWIAPSEGTIDGAALVGLICASLAFVGLYFAANQLMANFQALNAASSRRLS